MEYSAQGYNNLEKTDAQKKNSRTRVLVGGSLLTIIVTISVIIGVVIHQSKEAEDTSINGGGDDPDHPVDPVVDPEIHEVDQYDMNIHPMLRVYSQMPDFTSIGTSEGSDEKLKTNFWEDTWYGGPVYNPVYKWEYEKDENGDFKKTAEGEYIPVGDHNDIPNTMFADLNNEWDAKTGNYGYFKLRNIEKNAGSSGALGRYFVDIEFWGNDIPQDKWDFLMEHNNTGADEGQRRGWNTWSPYVNGYGRLVFYKQTSASYYPGTTIYNPNDVPNVIIQEVYETYLEEGLGNKDPMYGRIYTEGSTCKVGFLSYDTRPLKPALLGKGILLPEDPNQDNVEEGIFDFSDDQSPVEAKVIEDFYENELIQ